MTVQRSCTYFDAPEDGSGLNRESTEEVFCNNFTLRHQDVVEPVLSRSLDAHDIIQGCNSNSNNSHELAGSHREST